MVVGLGSAVAGEVADVDLASPARAPKGRSRGHRHGHVGGGRGLADGGLEHLGVEPGRRRIFWAARPVGSEHHVEVDETAALELDHLDVGEPERRPGLALGPIPRGGHRPVEEAGGADPQSRHVGVPKDRAGVVEALDAQRFAQGDRALFMALGTAERSPVRADLGSPRATGLALRSWTAPGRGRARTRGRSG